MVQRPSAATPHTDGTRRPARLLSHLAQPLPFVLSLPTQALALLAPLRAELAALLAYPPLSGRSAWHDAGPCSAFEAAGARA